MAHYLPGIYEKLEIFTSKLPFHERSPAHPFSGFVLNFGVSTKGHRDHGDDGVCAVFTFQNCSGGEICLYEPGLVFESGDGDLIIFQSKKITHFNQHFDGIRGSLVLHSDAAGRVWGERYNDWNPHIH